MTEAMGAYVFHRGVGIVFKICREDEGMSLEDVCRVINKSTGTENPDGDYLGLTPYELEALECGHRIGVPIYFWYRLFGAIGRKLGSAIELIESPGYMDGVRSVREGRIDQVADISELEASLRVFLRCPTASQ